MSTVRSSKKFSGQVREYFKEYCNSTSIHGFRYFGEDRTVFERIWWLIIFVICLSGCFVMIHKIYEKYDNTPVIVTFATKETSIYKIPFPAITICPEAKAVRKVFNFSRTTHLKEDQKETSRTDDRYFDYLSLICDYFDSNISSSKETFSSDFFAALEEIKPSLSNIAPKCEFMGYEFECVDIMVPIMTDEGVCYSFNILDRSDIYNDLVVFYKNFHETNQSATWTLEHGYLDATNVNAYPRRALFAGATNGFVIHLRTFKDDIDYRCKSVQGYRVLLHTPARIPRLKQEYFRIPLGQAVVTAVQPAMITTSEAVKSYRAEKRDCCFPFERDLKFFRTYSQLNCQLECLTNFTVDLCNCVDIYMPRDKNTPICGNGNHDCVRIAEKILQTGGIYGRFQPKTNKQMEMLDCDCMPLCSDLSYHTETSQTNLNSEYSDQEIVHHSTLTVYFKFNHFITSERNELYGPTDFLANFGGLLGLFTGFSFLSLMEIIYFLTVRICCNLKLYDRWAGKQEE